MLVTREDKDGVATLTLNRPDKLNAINIPLMVELRTHLDTMTNDPSLRCVIVTGAGRSFCSGHDLESIASGGQAPSRHFEPETIDALEQLPMPTIAKIRGHCYTGGLELALACDLLVASEDAKLGDTHGQWGLAPIWGMSVRLPERVGRSRAKELMFTSRRISGIEAAAIGLVDRAITETELDDAVAELAAEITSNSPGTNRIDKALLSTNADRLRTDALLIERNMPFGMPEDRKERMSTSRRARPTERA
ncbi:MAG: enoyl-CoA hydratase/isomerase family protein [Myxococcales bacterium]|nr:enoyl-CoA hydratase/isomerase family protein [Myxococcales bacterium]HIK84973.1 enoyl-CoA hydratase/isomerase family protein [Myxococcales bacterium]